MFVLKKCDIEPERFTDSMMHWNDMEHDRQIKEYMLNITQEIHGCLNKSPKIKREDAMKAAALLETKKMNAEFKTMMQVKSGLVPEEMQGKIMNFEKMLALDELFNDIGFEENQIEAAAEEYNFKEDVEFLSMMEQVTTLFRTTVKKQMEEVNNTA